eukprot:RCo012760
MASAQVLSQTVTPAAAPEGGQPPVQAEGVQRFVAQVLKSAIDDLSVAVSSAVDREREKAAQTVSAVVCPSPTSNSGDLLLNYLSTKLVTEMITHADTLTAQIGQPFAAPATTKLGPSQRPGSSGAVQAKGGSRDAASSMASQMLDQAIQKAFTTPTRPTTAATTAASSSTFPRGGGPLVAAEWSKGRGVSSALSSEMFAHAVAASAVRKAMSASASAPLSGLLGKEPSAAAMATAAAVLSRELFQRAV